MRTKLQNRILRFIKTFGASECFDDLAVAIHQYQYDRDRTVRALAPRASTVASIPAVPVGLFRDLPVGTVDPNDPHAWFKTSGTTSGRSGIHRMRDTTAYDAGCQAWAAAFIPRVGNVVALMADDPHSSLAHMIRGFRGPQNTTFVAEIETIVITRPTFLCTTAFALDHWLSRDPPPLPEGSAILTTGGFKGRRHERDADTLIRDAACKAPVVLEYGMTELSSQLWARPGNPYAPPPWLRVTAVDPHSGEPVDPGTAGQLRFLDLCNLDSTVHIETLDHGIVHEDGRLTLFGRLPDAPIRGCSLSAEDLLDV